MKFYKECALALAGFGMLAAAAQAADLYELTPLRTSAPVSASDLGYDVEEDGDARAASSGHSVTTGHSTCTDCASSCSDECMICNDCCGCPAIQFWTDATLLRFHKTGGVRVGNDLGEDAEMGYFVSPRFNLRYYRPNGMYTQLSYFEFNHGTLLSANDSGSHLGVRNWTLDLVTGERFMLNKDWVIDWNGGVRLFDYTESAIDRNEISNGNPEFNFDHSWGIGATVGLEASRCLGRGLSVVGGARFGVVHGDHTMISNRDGVFSNRRLLDENFIQLEVFTGFEHSLMLRRVEMITRTGWQWTTFENASSQFTSAGLAESTRTAGADVGYGGYSFSLGIYY